ncbi:MAG: polymerase subunit sigma-24, partial [Ilumatobacteraceae bacterium]|nr:polymerase subunit sigma-24 [Ilumatobacteraceae bacterium]
GRHGRRRDREQISPPTIGVAATEIESFVGDRAEQVGAWLIDVATGDVPARLDEGCRDDVLRVVRPDEDGAEADQFFGMQSPQALVERDAVGIIDQTHVCLTLRTHPLHDRRPAMFHGDDKPRSRRRWQWRRRLHVVIVERLIEQSEGELLRRGAMSDDDLLDLYERTIDDLYRYASRLTGGDRAMAEEIVQDTYLAVLRRIRGGDVVTVDLGWLIVSCRHRFLDRLKSERRSKRREMLATSVGSDAVSAGRAVDALAVLPVEHRTALVLRYVDDLPVREVARAMRRSEHATESLLARARASLRAVLTARES